MLMIWLEKDESIVMNDNCLVSVLSVSVDEVRLCITVREALWVCWSESADQEVLELGECLVMIVTVADIRDGRICIEADGSEEIHFERREVYSAEHGSEAADFSRGNSVFVNRRKNEYVLIQIAQ